MNLAGAGREPAHKVCEQIQAAVSQQQTQHAAAKAMRKLSVKSWRKSRLLPAPRALRTASSRSRFAIRASVRFATLAHAMRSTNAAAARRRSSVGRASRVSSSCKGAAEEVKPTFSGYDFGN